MTNKQHQEIRAKALQEHRPAAELIRELIDAGLSQQQPANAAEALLGLSRLGQELDARGPADLSTRLDDYLYGA